MVTGKPADGGSSSCSAPAYLSAALDSPGECDMRRLLCLVSLSRWVACSAPAPPATPQVAPTQAPAQQPAAATSWDKVVADAHTETTLVLNNGAGSAGQALLDVFQSKYPWLQVQSTSLAAS